MADTDQNDLQARRENLHALLKVAMKVELTTIPPYLHAMFSIEDVGDGTSNREPREAIRSVLVEEMLHLTLAANILSAVGGRAALDEATWVPSYPCQLFPKEALGLTLGGQAIDHAHELEVHLRPFCRDQVAVFEDIEAQHKPVEPQPGKVDIASIGQFYTLLYEELKDMVETFGEAAIFCGDPADQVGPEYYYAGGGTLITIDPKNKPLEHAQAAISLITEEGEGAGHGDTIRDGQAVPGVPGEDIAHVFKFREILAGRRYKDDSNVNAPPRGAPYDVDWDAVWPTMSDPNTDDPSLPAEVRAAMRDFDTRYSDLLRMINRGFNGEAGLLVEAVHGMFELKYAGVALMRTPVGHKRTAAPPWCFRAEGS